MGRQGVTFCFRRQNSDVITCHSLLQSSKFRRDTSHPQAVADNSEVYRLLDDSHAVPKGTDELDIPSLGLSFFSSYHQEQELRMADLLTWNSRRASAHEQRLEAQSEHHRRQLRQDIDSHLAAIKTADERVLWKTVLLAIRDPNKHRVVSDVCVHIQELPQADGESTMSFHDRVGKALRRHFVAATPESQTLLDSWARDIELQAELQLQQSRSKDRQEQKSLEASQRHRDQALGELQLTAEMQRWQQQILRIDGSDPWDFWKLQQAIFGIYVEVGGCETDILAKGGSLRLLDTMQLGMQEWILQTVLTCPLLKRAKLLPYEVEKLENARRHLPALLCQLTRLALSKSWPNATKRPDLNASDLSNAANLKPILQADHGTRYVMRVVSCVLALQLVYDEALKPAHIFEPGCKCVMCGATTDSVTGAAATLRRRSADKRVDRSLLRGPPDGGDLPKCDIEARCRREITNWFLQDQVKCGWVGTNIQRLSEVAHKLQASGSDLRTSGECFAEMLLRKAQQKLRNQYRGTNPNYPVISEKWYFVPFWQGQTFARLTQQHQTDDRGKSRPGKGKGKGNHRAGSDNRAIPGVPPIQQNHHRYAMNANVVHGEPAERKTGQQPPTADATEPRNKGTIPAEYKWVCKNPRRSGKECGQRVPVKFATCRRCHGTCPMPEDKRLRLCKESGMKPRYQQQGSGGWNDASWGSGGWQQEKPYGKDSWQRKRDPPNKMANQAMVVSRTSGESPPRVNLDDYNKTSSDPFGPES